MIDQKMKEVTTIVLIPVGPTCKMDFIEDTIESVQYYLKLPYQIIVVDDSACGAGNKIKNKYDEIIIIGTEGKNGHFAGLYFSLSQGLKYAYENFKFTIVIRMDTDALLIGFGLDEEAVSYFHKNPLKGIIGSYMFDCNGAPRGIYWTGIQLKNEISTGFLLRNVRKKLKGWKFLRGIFRKSIKFGYIPGEHCMGGAYIMSWECVNKLYNANLLDRKEIHFTKLQEDQIFGLLIYAVGLRHGDFATGSFPMGLRWKGLPGTPEDLVIRKKKIIHSTRFYEELNEEQIRDFFKKRRNLYFL